VILRTAGRVVGALLVPAALLGLSGCTPAAKPVVALDYVKGRPTAVIVSCADVKVDSVTVTDTTTDPSPNQWAASTTSAPAPAQLTLLDTPAGWTVSKGTLTEFQAGHKYLVSPYAGAHKVEPINFTVDQLSNLADGQVLTGESGSRTKTVSEKDFRKAATDSC
jgi:hypothetical protein